MGLRSFCAIGDAAQGRRVERGVSKLSRILAGPDCNRNGSEPGMETETR